MSNNYVMSNKQTTFDSLAAPESSPTPNEQEIIEASLLDAGVQAPARRSLNAAFDSLDALLDASDESLKQYHQVGPSAIDAIREELDPTYVNDEYTIEQTDSGVKLDKWTDRTGAYVHITTGEVLINELLSAEHLGHQATIINTITNWVGAYEQSTNNTPLSKSIQEAAYSLTPHEVNFATLLPEDDRYESVDALEDAVNTATQKATLLMTFCRETGRREVCVTAAKAARKTLQKKRDEEKRAQQRQRRADRILKHYVDEIEGWSQVRKSHFAYIAYRGWFRDRPTIVALYETDEFVKVRAFPLSDWHTTHATADIEPRSGETAANELDNAFSEPTGMTPDTLEAGALALDDWLTSNSSETRPDVTPTIEGWILHTYTPEEELRYEIPEQDVEIIAEPDTLTLIDGNDDTQTIEIQDFDQACGKLRNFIGLNPAISKGGSPIEVPHPDD